MRTSLSLLDLTYFFLLYSFLGWVAEVGYYAVARRKFHNRGILSLPFLLSYGFTFCLLILVLPTLEGNFPLQFFATFVIASVVENLSTLFMHRVGSKFHWGAERDRVFSGSGKGFLQSLAMAALFYLCYLMLHPVLLVLLAIIPHLAEQITVYAILVLILADFFVVLYAFRTGKMAGFLHRQETGQQQRLGKRLFNNIWHRLQKAYPGIREMDTQEQEVFTFAKGLCLDKLIWVFLATALLGDIIETLFCGFVDGQWMNRSSVLYGPFSFVWGIGAVVLTVTLQRFAGKNDRYVFLAGFVIGGVYEYMCSVFTELVFGTVFWDYSEMPLNIGGRTNVLFCFFWGVLALVWVKILYPPMSRSIEKLPPLTGKILTWAVVFFMVCNALLTSFAMLRYETRAYRPASDNIFEEFLDRHYGDDYMESRWPNMVVTSSPSDSK